MKALLPVLAVVLVAAPAAAQEYVPGEVTEFEIPLSLGERRNIGRGNIARTDRALCAVAVPRDFDPGRTWPVLVVSATSDPGYNSSRLWLRERYADTALAAGWVVVAADPPTPQPPQVDSPELRYVLARAALNHLELTWPGIARWPLAFGGFSGGSKHSVNLAAQAVREGRLVIGLFLGGCNRDPSYTAVNHFSPPRQVFRRIPIFLSGGEGDRVATPADQRTVATSLRANGFGQVRYETYPGVHEFHPPHLADALAWFRELHLPVGASIDAPLPGLRD